MKILSCIVKKTTLAVLLVLAALQGRAQIGTDFGVNMFVSLGGGITRYQSIGMETATGFAGSASVGKWILRPLAFRLGIDLQTVQSRVQKEGNTADFLCFSTEFLWDISATFWRPKVYRVNAYPIIGLGFSYRDSINNGKDGHGGVDNDFHTMLGIHIPVRLGRGWDVFIEGKTLFFPQNYDGGHGDVFMHSVIGGFTYRFSETPFTRRTEFESRTASEDWFIGFGVGPLYSSFEFAFMNKIGMYGVTPEIMFGRNYSNFWTIRFELNGLTAHQPYDTINDEGGDSYTFSFLHADLMFNLSHAIKFTRGVRLNVLPYLGAGPIWRYDKLSFDMAADAGVMGRYYLNEIGDLYADVRYTMIPPRVGGGMGESHKVTGVGYLSLTFGYIHNFGYSTTRYRMPVNYNNDYIL